MFYVMARQLTLVFYHLFRLTARFFPFTLRNHFAFLLTMPVHFSKATIYDPGMGERSQTSNGWISSLLVKIESWTDFSRMEKMQKVAIRNLRRKIWMILSMLLRDRPAVCISCWGEPHNMREPYNFWYHSVTNNCFILQITWYDSGTFQNLCCSVNRDKLRIS